MNGEREFMGARMFRRSLVDRPSEWSASLPARASHLVARKAAYVEPAVARSCPTKNGASPRCWPLDRQYVDILSKPLSKLGTELPVTPRFRPLRERRRKSPERE